MIKTEHHDLFNENTRTFAKTIDDVVKIPLSVKEAFLENHGHGYISQIANRKLRNAIAHSSFKIDDDGSMIILKNNRFSERITLDQLAQVYSNVIKLNQLLIEVSVEGLDITADDVIKYAEKMEPKKNAEIFTENIEKKNKKMNKPHFFLILEPLSLIQTG